MAGFSFHVKQLHDIVNIMTLMEQRNIPLSELKAYVEKKKIEIRNIKAKRKKDFEDTLKKCPGCGRGMMPSPVNISSQTRTGDDSKVVYT